MRWCLRHCSGALHSSDAICSSLEMDRSRLVGGGCHVNGLLAIFYGEVFRLRSALVESIDLHVGLRLCVMQSMVLHPLLAVQEQQSLARRGVPGRC